jgi:hypothetical protein
MIMLGCTVLLAVATLCGCQPAATPSQPPAAVTTGEFKTADDLLNALETADHGLQSLTADVKYDRTFEIQGDRQIHLGKLWFSSEPPKNEGEPPQRKFAIHFDRVFVGPVQRTQDKTYIFDGQWMMEKDGEAKFYQKKQVVGPGEHFDPLKVGEGPFVLPIGQRKGDILKRFTAELLPPSAGLDAAKDATDEEKRGAEASKGDVEGAWQLKLTPREGAKDEDFTEVRLWYKRGTQGELLPRMARTVNPAGDVSLVLLINVEVQLAGKPENAAAKVPPEDLDTTSPQGWEGTVQSWRKAADAEGRERPDAGDK